LWDTGFHWGEWLEPGFEIADFGAFVAADKGGRHRLPPQVGRDDGSHRGSPRQACRDRGAVRAPRCGDPRHGGGEYVSDDGTLVVRTQAGHVRALMFDLLPHELRSRVADRLAALVREAGTTVGTGFLSTGMLLPALAEHGHVDLAYELLLQPNEPGWMAMIDRGATTVWERWNGVDEHGIPHESLNHYSKGAVASFLHRYVAGLAPTSPGYRSFVVRPRPGGDIDYVSQRLDTRHGCIEIEWRRRGAEFELRLSVPTGTVATVELPNNETITVDAVHT
jgi:alpha-L-rhamnosidase